MDHKVVAQGHLGLRLNTMPFESPEQRKAMYAAASGHGNIGISKAGAKKFVRHTNALKRKKRRGRNAMNEY